MEDFINCSATFQSIARELLCGNHCCKVFWQRNKKETNKKIKTKKIRILGLFIDITIVIAFISKTLLSLTIFKLTFLTVKLFLLFSSVFVHFCQIDEHQCHDQKDEFYCREASDIREIVFFTQKNTYQFHDRTQLHFGNFTKWWFLCLWLRWVQITLFSFPFWRWFLGLLGGHYIACSLT